MKKLFLTLFILILCCSLLGCSIYDKTDSEFTGKSDDSAASSNGGSGESGDGLGDAAPQPVTSTDEELSGEYYVGDGFRFVVPSVWRDHFAVETTTKMVEAYEVVYRNFYYEQDDGVRALMLTLTTTDLACYTNGLIGGTMMCTYSGGSKCVVNSVVSESIPDGFADYSAYSSIYEDLASDAFTVESTN